MTIINNLKQVRRRKGITQKVLAWKAGVSRQTIYNLENSYTIPSIELAYAVATALNTDIYTIWSGGRL